MPKSNSIPSTESTPSFLRTTSKSPKGKLRLLYECNPLAFIIEQAGGKATDGFHRIMELDIKELHQRTPLFIGSSDMVDMAGAFMKKYSTIDALINE